MITGELNRSTHKKSYSRDTRVLAHLERCKCLNTEQIHLLEFLGLSIEMAHRCCRRLVKRKRIKRGERISFSEKDFFWSYDEKRPNMSTLEHTLGKGWIYAFMVLRARASNFPITFENEPKQFLPIVQPDQFITLKYKLTNDIRPFFCEFNRHESGNQFAKIAQYNLLAEKLIKEKSQGIHSYWWTDLNKDQNITVLIVTTGSTMPIRAIIDRDKAFPYLVELLTLEEVVRFCYSLHSQKKGELSCSQEYQQPRLSLPSLESQSVSRL